MGSDVEYAPLARALTNTPLPPYRLACQPRASFPVAILLDDCPSLLTIVSPGYPYDTQPTWLSVHETIVRTIRRNRAHNQLFSYLLQPVVGLATIDQMSFQELDQSPSCFLVSLANFKPDVFLTSAYRSARTNSDTFPPATFLNRTSPFSHDWYDPRQQSLKGLYTVLTIRYDLDRAKITFILASLLLLAPCLGGIVYAVTRQVDAAVATGAAVFALASLLQGLIAWMSG